MEDQIENPNGSPQKVIIDNHLIRRSICRYGCGCTHISDPSHREKFWHPPLKSMSDEHIQSHFICNECGFHTQSLSDLQLHLKRKTAWSNLSLIGCRINCLIDMKEWHEGFVSQFHKSGKHLIEFKILNDRRWLNMKKMAFYIVERPHINPQDSSEIKSDNEDEDNLAPIEENWVHCEDISFDFTFAQSVLFKIYGNSLQETGHLTKGHVSVTDADRLTAQKVKSNLLYGELLPRGANKAFGAQRLDVGSVNSLFDMGMGTGKIVLQAFLQFPKLKYTFGVELSSGRYRLAEEAALKMVELLGPDRYNVQLNSGRYVIITEQINPESQTGQNDGLSRVLHLQCGNMFDVDHIATADIVMMETDIPHESYIDLYHMICKMRPGSKMLSYIDMRRLCDFGPVPLKQIDINRHLSDRYTTSWSVQRGHHFYLWTRCLDGEALPSWNKPQSNASLSLQTPEENGDHDEDPDNNPTQSGFLSPNLDLSLASIDSTESTRCLPFSFFGFFSFFWRGFGRSNSNGIHSNMSTSRNNEVPHDRQIIPFNSPPPPNIESNMTSSSKPSNKSVGNQQETSNLTSSVQSNGQIVPQVQFPERSVSREPSQSAKSPSLSPISPQSIQSPTPKISPRSGRAASSIVRSISFDQSPSTIASFNNTPSSEYGLQEPQPTYSESTKVQSNQLAFSSDIRMSIRNNPNQGEFTSKSSSKKKKKSPRPSTKDPESPSIEVRTSPRT